MKDVWKFLDGKKTNIGALLMLAALGTRAFFPQLMTSEQISFLEATAALLGGTGLFHQGLKSQTGKDLLSKIKPRKN